MGREANLDDDVEMENVVDGERIQDVLSIGTDATIQHQGEQIEALQRQFALLNVGYLRIRKENDILKEVLLKILDSMGQDDIEGVLEEDLDLLRETTDRDLQMEHVEFLKEKVRKQSTRRRGAGSFAAPTRAIREDSGQDDQDEENEISEDEEIGDLEGSEESSLHSGEDEDEILNSSQRKKGDSKEDKVSKKRKIQEDQSQEKQRKRGRPAKTK